MSIVDSTTLHYQDSRSDKVYHAYIEQGLGGTFAVAALYGRRGQTLKETRKGHNLTQYAAQTTYDDLLREKMAKGYVTVSPSATQY